MKIAKPKGPTPSLIGSTLGTPKLGVVARKSYCKRCNTTLEKGTVCYGIPQLQDSFNKPKRYCDNCFHTILQKTLANLNELIRASGAAV